MSSPHNDKTSEEITDHLEHLTLQPYEEDSQEPLADHPFFDPQLSEAIEQAKRIAGDVAATLASCSMVKEKPESEIAKHFHEALRLEEFECSETRTIGVIGESGQGRFLFLLWLRCTDQIIGKSSLINSLLGVPNIAKTV
jgi:hypothetical protein